MRHLPIEDGWQLRERDQSRALDQQFADDHGWIAARVPGSVHEALLDAGRIPDPFFGLNERDVQWVGERDWLYRRTFEIPASDLGGESIALCFDGLDTFATVWLNGAEIARSDNMWVPQRVVVTDHLRAGRNDLHILFESALRRGKELEAEHGARAVWNGDPSRVYVRKAQYHYGWDWGPCLLTAGPWQPIRLEIGDARITDLHAPVEVADDLGSATIDLSLAIDGGAGDLRVALRLLDPDGAPVAEHVASIDGTLTHRIAVDAPRLWWPNGYGDQPLYRLEATLLRGDTEIDRREIRLGLRRLRLVQEPLRDEPGTTFLFEINRTPIFSGGANWIPADSFTTRIPDARYHTLLQAAADANMVMLRVWGGGIYEADLFYDLCDELGLLVWQDFMFACGMYPAHESFQASVRAEAEAQARRLRHHASLALWCGNNEDYQIAGSLEAYDISVDPAADAQFPARAIYERLLPEVCAALDPQHAYWPGSAYGGSDVSDQTVGDRHTWEIWHGPMAPYRQYPHYEGRFVSEFGMAACPAPETIEAFTSPEERYPGSRTMEFHNKATDGHRHLAVYISDTVRPPTTLDEYIYATQLIQAEALDAAYRGWRRRWHGPGRYAVAGALVWQINDCYPVTSWAIIDSYLRPKPAYYAVRRAMAPLLIGMARSGDQIDLWAVNSGGQAVTGELLIHTWTLDGDQRSADRRPVTLEPNRSTELAPLAIDSGAQLVVAARLLVGDTVVARATVWPEPFKYLALPDPEIAVERVSADQVVVRANRPAKGVWLSGGDGVNWSDNMIDVLPDDPQTITARGLDGGTVDVRSLR